MRKQNNSANPMAKYLIALSVFGCVAVTLAFVFLPDNLAFYAPKIGQESSESSPAAIANAAQQTSSDNSKNKVVLTKRLAIQLKAVFAGENGSGTALVESGGIPKRYNQGDRLKVPGEVFLHAVYSDHIVLSNNGIEQRYFLRFDPAQLQQQLAKAQAAEASSRSAIRSTIDVNAPEFQNIVGDKIKQRILSKPLSFARYVFVLPRKENDNTTGYTLRPGPDKRLFEQTGLQAGDVLLAINKQEVGGLSQQQMMHIVASNQNIELPFERNGVPHSAIVAL